MCSVLHVIGECVDDSAHISVTRDLGCRKAWRSLVTPRF